MRFLLVVALAMLQLGMPASAAEPVSYAAVRLVKATPSAPSAPEITLPAGYTMVPGEKHQVASRAEFYFYFQGPRSTGVEISVRWPGTPISVVVEGKNRITPVTEPERVRFTVPVLAASPNAASWTVQVSSYLSGSTASGRYWRVEHNDPDRVAGPWTSVAWPAGQVKAVVNHMAAADVVLRDSGLVEKARQRGHFFALMGFETNNTLHTDNPPHWHLSYYPGQNFNAPKAHVPHFWVDKAGANFYNGMDVVGEGRKKFYVGDPAPIHDAEGQLVVTLTIRADGGLDIAVPNGATYGVLPAEGGFTEGARVLRDGQPLTTVRATDDVRGGVLTLPGAVHRYDPLTGALT